jgi:choline-sulfatase
VSDQRPNILVILSDQHSKRALGAYGNPTVRTPSLDRLAEEGMVFDNAYCPAPLCVPSRMSFMTGRTPSRNRVWNNNHILSSSIPTWAHALGVAGYETALVGRMHFVGADQRHGFEKRPIGEFWAHPPGVDVPGGPWWSPELRGTAGQSRRAVEVAGHGRTSYQWFDEQVADTACRFLQERGAGSDGRPFAAVMGLVLPHCPFIAPRELFEYYYDRVDIPQVEAAQPETIRRFREFRGILDPLSEHQIRAARAAYFGMCEHMDRQIGRVLGTLDETGLAENTLVIYTSDHGECAGEHGCWWKSNFYEASVGVPLIARGPVVRGGGTRSDVLTTLADLPATFCELAGTDLRPQTDGESILEALAGGSIPDRDVFSELCDSRGAAAFLPCRMIRSGKWKLWRYADEANLPPALFNLEEDPDEVDDLAGKAEYAELVARLSARLREGWEPERVRREAAEKNEEHAALVEWGRVMQPPAPDMLAAPDYRELEQDLTLV